MKRIFTTLVICFLGINSFAQSTSTGYTLLTPNGNSIKTSSLKIGDGNFTNTAKLMITGVGEQIYPYGYSGYISQLIDAQPVSNILPNQRLVGIHSFARNNSFSTSQNYSIIGISESMSNGGNHPENTGVLGQAGNISTNNRSNNYGVYGSAPQNTNRSNRGVYGYASNSYQQDTTYFGNAYGVYGFAYGNYMTKAYGGYFTGYSASNNSSNRSTYGIYADAYGDVSSLSTKIGAYANSSNTNNMSYGLQASAYNNYQADTSIWRGNVYGVYGYANGNKNYSNVGVYGVASDAMTSNYSKTIVGVEGTAFSNNSNLRLNIIGVRGVLYNSISDGIGDNNAKTGGQFRAFGSNTAWVKGIDVYAGSQDFSAAAGMVYGADIYAYSANPNNTASTYGIRSYVSGASAGDKYGIYSEVSSSANGTKYAGYFKGDVLVTGMLSKSGGAFKIDHPQDPQNKYLIHSFVESPEMKNIYDGLVTTDASGNATVTMPSYFEALNVTFRYQLTCIGEFAQAIIAQKISGNQFKIKTDKPNIEVSWQVTGVRNDAWAKENPIIVEQEKEANAKGKYLNPEVFKQPRSMAIHASEEKKVDYDAENKIRLAEFEREEKSRLENQKIQEENRKQEAEQRQKMNLQQQPK